MAADDRREKRGVPNAATASANVALAHRFRDEVIPAGDLDAADEILALDVVWHAAGVPPDRDGVKTSTERIRAAFPDLTMKADQVVAEGDQAAILWTLRGTHQGEFLGVPATRNSVATPGIDIYRIANGQIAEVWTVGDDLGLLFQLGGFPSSGGEAKPGASDNIG